MGLWVSRTSLCYRARSSEGRGVISVGLWVSRGTSLCYRARARSSEGRGVISVGLWVSRGTSLCYRARSSEGRGVTSVGLWVSYKVRAYM